LGAVKVGEKGTGSGVEVCFRVVGLVLWLKWVRRADEWLVKDIPLSVKEMYNNVEKIL
jgi:hypothetical protein